MDTVKEIERAIERLSQAERRDIATWMDGFDLRDYRVEEPAAAYSVERKPRYLSVAEYLESEERTQERHEYINGAVYAMSGATERHSLVAGNLFAAFHAHLGSGPCKVHIADFKLRLEINREDVFYYPDIMVACGREGVEANYLRYPKLVVEVLSPSTESIDRREKFMNYRQVPTIEEYVLAAQRSPEVTIHRRKENWAPRLLTGPEAMAEFRSIELTLPLTQIYARLPS